MRIVAGCLAAAAVLLLAAGCGGAAEQRQRAAPAPPVLAFVRGGSDADSPGRVWLLGEDRSVRPLAPGSDPEWSADGSHLTLIDGRDRLVLYDVKGGRRLRPVRGTVDRVLWAPVGNRFAYTSPSEYAASCDPWVEPRLVVFDLGQDASKRIAGSRLCEPKFSFDWSPDGRQLAYSTCELVGPGSHQEYSCDALVVNRDGSGRRRVLKNASIYDLAWSPDGRALALEMTLRTGYGEGDVKRDSTGAWLLDLASGKFTQLARDETGNAHASWSPDGRLYVSAGWKLWAVPAVGARSLLARDVASFTWSPDGRWLAYASNVGGRCYSFECVVDEPNGIWLVRSRDGKRRLLAKPNKLVYDNLSWSPSRNLLVATTSSGSVLANSGLVVLDPRTGAVVHRTLGDDSAPVWRP